MYHFKNNHITVKCLLSLNIMLLVNSYPPLTSRQIPCTFWSSLYRHLLSYAWHNLALDFGGGVYYCCPSKVVSILPSPLPSAPPIPASHPWSYPLWLCPWVLYICPLWPFFPYFPPLSLSPLVTVSLFFISMTLVIVCLLVHFVDYVLLIGEIIWYLSFTSWFVSLSIMLSRSIHAIAKGRSSFFLSAV